MKPSKTYKGKFEASSLYFSGYLDLFITISSILNVCILATEGDPMSPPYVKSPPEDIRRVLELANSLLPMEEGEFLVEIYGLLQKDQEEKQV